MNLPFSKSEENFASIDYAVYRAGQLGLKLIVPLTGRDMNQLIFSKKQALRKFSEAARVKDLTNDNNKVIICHFESKISEFKKELK